MARCCKRKVHRAGQPWACMLLLREFESRTTACTCSAQLRRAAAPSPVMCALRCFTPAVHHRPFSEGAALAAGQGGGREGAPAIATGEAEWMRRGAGSGREATRGGQLGGAASAGRLVGSAKGDEGATRGGASQTAGAVSRTLRPAQHTIKKAPLSSPPLSMPAAAHASEGPRRGGLLPGPTLCATAAPVRVSGGAVQVAGADLGRVLLAGDARHVLLLTSIGALNFPMQVRNVRCRGAQRAPLRLQVV